MRQICEQLWVIERPFRLMGAELGTRATVVRLPDNLLWVHSPVKLHPEVQSKLDQLGAVRYVVAPSRMHHLFIKDYQVTYPGSFLYGVQELVSERDDISFHAQLGAYSPAGWGGAFDQQQVRGIPRVNEVAFLHHASRTLIVTDLLMCFPDMTDRWTRLFLRLDGVGRDCAVSRLIRFAIRDRGALRLSIERILEWEFDRIVMSHGVVVERGGKEAFAKAFDWLLS